MRADRKSNRASAFIAVLALIHLFGALALSGTASAAAQAPANWPADLSTVQQRIEAVRSFADGIARNDAEAINAGWSGRAGWTSAVERALHGAKRAPDPFTLGIVFRRLYAAYPSLHSHLDLRRDIDLRAAYGAPYLPFALKAERVGPGVTPARVFVSSVRTDDARIKGGPLSVGDEIVAINGQAIGAWLSRSPNVCRRNSRWQCYGDFDAQLRNELLGWDRRQALELQILRGGTSRTIRYEPEAVPTRSAQRNRTGCGEDELRYDGFAPVYTGLNLCVFRSLADSSVELWRIKSFSYREDGPINSVQSEVDRFWSVHWSKTSASISKLVIDLAGNGGGNVPMPWYALLFDRPYQEQYAQYLRLPAYDNPAILAQETDDEAHARWFDRLKATNPGAWAKTDDFLPPVPQFCAPNDNACSGTLFAPRSHGFKGRVALLVDDNCVSSCSGFVWNILNVLPDRAAAFGLPDSGDSNFKRAPLKLTFAGGRWATTIADTSVEDASALVTANVMVTRTTTSAGALISGRSSEVTKVTNRRWNDSHSSWANRALKDALAP